MDIIRIAPNNSSCEKYEKTTQELKCPFCGHCFEVAELNVCERKAQTIRTPEDQKGYYIRQVSESFPIELRCTECGIEIRNILFKGLYTRIENYKTSLERRDCK